jgi:hypothetical protein
MPAAKIPRNLTVMASGHQTTSQGPKIDDKPPTSGAPIDQATVGQERPEAHPSEDQGAKVVVRPVAEREVGGREDSEAREDVSGTDRREFEEMKEPVMAFESHHTDIDDRASPEAPKAEDYMDEDDITYENMKAQTSKIGGDQATLEEAARLAEAQRKRAEADLVELAEQREEANGMSLAAEQISSKYSSKDT